MEKRTFLKIGLGLAVSEIAYWGAMFGLSFLLPMLIVQVMPTDILPGIRSAILNLIYVAALYCVMILFLWLFTRKIPMAPKKPKQNLSVGMFFACLAICFGFSYIFSFCGSFVNDLFQGGIRSLFSPIFNFPEPGSYVEPEETTLEFIASAICSVIYAPVFEEILFRKMLLGKLRPFGDTTAILFSGFAFGLTHMNFRQFFFATAIGFVLGYVMIKTNRLIYPILFHFIFNSMSSLVYPFAEWLDGKIGIMLAFLAFVGFTYFAMVLAPTLFFTNLKRIKLDRPEYRFSRPLGGKMIFANAGTIIYLIVASATFVATALLNALDGR